MKTKDILDNAGASDEVIEYLTTTRNLTYAASRTDVNWSCIDVEDGELVNYADYMTTTGRINEDFLSKIKK